MQSDKTDKLYVFPVGVNSELLGVSTFRCLSGACWTSLAGTSNGGVGSLESLGRSSLAIAVAGVLSYDINHSSFKKSRSMERYTEETEVEILCAKVTTVELKMGTQRGPYGVEGTMYVVIHCQNEY